MNTKQEFIDSLRRALNGKISPEEVEEHIRYYDDYITAESRIRGSEKAVLDSLGSPRLIAMSICAADEAEDKANNTGSTHGSSQSYYNGDTAYEGYDEERRTKDNRPFIIRHPKLTIALIIIAIILVIVLLVSLAFSLLKFFWPAIVFITFVLLAVRLIAYWRDNT